MSELTEWLRDVLNEVEHAARRAPEGPWRTRAAAIVSVPREREHDGDDIVLLDVWNSDVAKFVTLISPDVVLRQVEATRRILDEVVPAMDRMESVIEGEWGSGDEGEPASAALVKLAAAPFRDWPGYREEWRPEAPSAG